MKGNINFHCLNYTFLKVGRITVYFWMGVNGKKLTLQWHTQCRKRWLDGIRYGDLFRAIGSVQRCNELCLHFIVVQVPRVPWLDPGFFLWVFRGLDPTERRGVVTQGHMSEGNPVMWKVAVFINIFINHGVRSVQQSSILQLRVFISVIYPDMCW